VSRNCRGADRHDDRLRPTPPVIPASCRSMRRSAAGRDWFAGGKIMAKHTGKQIEEGARSIIASQLAASTSPWALRDGGSIGRADGILPPITGCKLPSSRLREQLPTHLRIGP